MNQKLTIAEELNNEERLQIESDNPATEAQQRVLAFGSVLMTVNREPMRTINTWFRQADVANMLSEAWGIENTEEAISTSERLSTANVHTIFSDEIFNTLIKNGITEVTPDDILQYMDKFALRNTFERLVRHAAENVGLRLHYRDFVTTRELITAIGTIAANGIISSQNELNENNDEFPPLKIHAVTTVYNNTQNDIIEQILEQLTEDANKSLETYKNAYNFLIELGYTPDELSQINTVAAWDYGRTALISRYSVTLGFMEESQAWEFLQAAADNCTPLYNSWREFLVAYILGRAIAYKRDSRDHQEEIEFLVHSPESPFAVYPY